MCIRRRKEWMSSDGADMHAKRVSRWTPLVDIGVLAVFKYTTLQGAFG